MSALFFLAPRVPRSGKLAPALSKSWPELTRFVQRECTVNEWTLTILRHAQLHLSQAVLSVTDLGSRNGTFVRVTGEYVLKHGDYVFLGQQLLRVEIV